MDEIKKVFNKLFVDERRKIKKALEELKRSPWKKNLDIKKLKDRDDIYRVRKGDIRIIFRMKNQRYFYFELRKEKPRRTNKTCHVLL